MFHQKSQSDMLAQKNIGILEINKLYVFDLLIKTLFPKVQIIDNINLRLAAKICAWQRKI